MSGCCLWALKQLCCTLSARFGLSPPHSSLSSRKLLTLFPISNLIIMLKLLYYSVLLLPIKFAPGMLTGVQKRLLSFFSSFLLGGGGGVSSDLNPCTAFNLAILNRIDIQVNICCRIMCLQLIYLLCVCRAVELSLMCSRLAFRAVQC